MTGMARVAGETAGVHGCVCHGVHTHCDWN